jgi:hypothetical protein
VNDKYNVYRAYAAFCERMSRESEGEDRKQSWLRLAADWLALIRDSSSTDSQSDSTKNDGSGPANGQRSPLTADQTQDDPPGAAEGAGESLPER